MSKVLHFPTNKNYLENLEKDIFEAIDKNIEENEITFAELIGILEMIKMKVNDIAVYGEDDEG